jgi:hypothetical protein
MLSALQLHEVWKLTDKSVEIIASIFIVVGKPKEAFSMKQ